MFGKRKLSRRDFMKFFSGTTFAGFASKIFPEVGLLTSSKGQLDDDSKAPSIREAKPIEYALFLKTASPLLEDFNNKSTPDGFALSHGDGNPYVAIIEEKYANVTYRFSGGAGYSYFAAVFDRQSSELLQTMSTFNTLKADDAIRTVHSNNDKTVMDIITTQDGEVVSGYVIDSQGKRVDATKVLAREDPLSTGFWSFFDCFEDCLIMMGVPAWVLTGVTIICAAVCIGTAGWGCFVCLNVAVSGYTTITTICWYDCQSAW